VSVKTVVVIVTVTVRELMLNVHPFSDLIPGVPDLSGTGRDGITVAGTLLKRPIGCPNLLPPSHSRV
jgi:hypothetical protein